MQTVGWGCSGARMQSLGSHAAFAADGFSTGFSDEEETPVRIPVFPQNRYSQPCLYCKISKLMCHWYEKQMENKYHLSEIAQDTGNHKQYSIYFITHTYI